MPSDPPEDPREDGPVIEELVSQEQVEALMSPDGPPAIIDFWAGWCGPCKAMAPHFEALAADLHGGPLRFYKLDTERHPRLAAAFNVRALPTFLLVERGEVRDALVGARPPHELRKRAEWLAKKASGQGFFRRLFG